MSEKNNQPKHVKATPDSLELELLQEIVLDNKLYVVERICTYPEVIESKHIFATGLFHEELLPYVVKYGYEVVNHFVLNFGQRLNEKNNG